MNKYVVQTTIGAEVFAENLQDLEEVVKNAFVYPPSHLRSVEVVEVEVLEVEPR